MRGTGHNGRRPTKESRWQYDRANEISYYYQPTLSYDDGYSFSETTVYYTYDGTSQQYDRQRGGMKESDFTDLRQIKKGEVVGLARFSSICGTYGPGSRCKNCDRRNLRK